MKILQKIKKRGDKIFSYISLFAMLANTLAPFSAMIPSPTYAEDIGAPVEVSVAEKKEEGVLEEADAEGPADGQDLAEEVESQEEITEENENEEIGGDNVNAPEEDVIDPEAPDILEDGVMDYNPINDIEEVLEVEEIPTPTIKEPVLENKEKEYEHLEDGVDVIDSSKEDWDVNDDVAETKEVVKIGVKYIFPLDEDVSVTFTKLPKSEEDRANLKIERVKVKDLNLPDEFKTDAEYAFDITTEGMENGEFEYDLTLPKPKDVEAEIIYIEDSLEEVKNGVDSDDVKKVEKDKIEQKEDKVEVEGLEHFTIYIVTTPRPTLSTAMVNGQPYVSVPPSTNVTVTLKVKTEGSGDSNDWKTTQYSLDGNNWTCVNTPNHTSSGTWTEDFTLKAPATVGSYDLHLRAYNGDNCTGGVSDILVLDDAIRVVLPLPSLTPPTLTNDPSDPVALTSVTGVWTHIDGGSGHQGINTNEIRWGIPTGSQKSGLRFTNSGNQSFDTGETFYLGMLTHMNWPVQRGTAAKGATLQITLNFDRPDIDDVVLDYDFDIEETPNEEGNCKVYQRTLTPCDDKVTFPNKYGTKVFTIGDIQYTLVIDGFVDAYPGGNPVDAFITEERKDNSAFLVGHLSSVLVERPEIRLTKKTNNQDISAAPGPNLYVGDAVEWKYIVQNSGNVTLSNINITDNPATDITCYSDEAYTTALSSPYTLASGQYMYCKALGTVTEGQYKNTATVTGTPPTGNNVSASDSSWYYGVQQKGHIIVDKVTNPAGDSQSFSFTTTGNGYNSFSLTDAAEPNNQELVAGTYSVTETVPAGWHSTASCTSSIAGKTQDPSALSLASGETINCTFTNTKYGSLTIVKNANPSSEEEFSFTTTGTGLSDFTLTDDSDTTNPSKVFNNLSSGTYSVSEGTLPSGWYLDSAVCSDQSPVSAIDLSVGENIICTFNNVKYGSISGRKLNDLDGNADTAGDRYPVSGYTIFIDANNNGKLDPGETSTETASDGTYSFTNLKPGTYTIVEVLKVGWIVLPNTSTSQSVTIVAGESKEGVNFINVKYGSIQVLKNVDGNGDGDLDDDVDVKGSDQWNWTINGEIVGKTGTTKSQLRPGRYEIKETGGLNNYHFVSLSCTGAADERINVVGDVATIQLESGENVVCTYTNARDTGTLIVRKEVKNDNGGILVAKDFSFKIDTGKGIVFNQDPTNPLLGENKLEKFPTGIYSITELEANQRGYATSYDNCSKVEVKKGETAVCTITNDDKPAKLTVVKKVINDNGGTATADDFNIKLNDKELKFELDPKSEDKYTSTYISTPEVQSNTKYILKEIDHSGYKEGTWSCKSNKDDDARDARPLPKEQVVAEQADKVPSTSFTLSPGDDIVCTITNDDLAPKLTLVKEVNNKDLPEDLRKAKEDWTLTATGPTTISGDGGVTSGADFKAGTYVLSETDSIPGFTSANGWSCEGATLQEGNKITLGVGDVVSCKIINESIYGKVVIEKQTTPDGSTSSFEFNPSWSETNFSLSDGQQHDSGWLVPGQYSVSEIVPTGWELTGIVCDDINSGSSAAAGDTANINLDASETVTCTFTNTQRPVTIVATKVVCDYEKDLPNYGYGAPVNITENTASDWIASHPSCRLEPDWSFQWGDDWDTNPSDSFVGEVAGWNTFGPTNSDGVATVTIDDFGRTSQIKVREVLKENYLPFTYLTNGSTNKDNVSAEIYCHTDVLNYDNDDRITPEYGNTYYCVAWNVQNNGSIQGEKYNDVNANGTFDDAEKDDLNRLNGWTINLYDLNWKLVDSMKTGDNEVGKGQYHFTNLLAGTYHVCEEQQEGWYQTYPASGSQYEDKGPYCHTVSLDPGQNVTNIQFGNYQGSDVTVCKLDAEENGLPGWKVILRGSDLLETVTVNPDGGVYSSSDLAKGNYALISYGTYEYRGNTGLLTDPGYSERLVADGYTGPYFPWINVMNLNTTGALGIMINGNPTNWGEYLSEDHRYALGFSDYENKFNFSVYDNIYPDNVGAMYVDIYNGYVGVTQEDGCYTFKNVPFGTYQVDEVMKDGWRNVSGLEEVTVDESTENFNIVNELKVYDIHGYKWSDLDGDGTLDSEEPLLSGWRIFIDKNENSVWDADEPSMLTTDDDEHYGWFWFEDLLPGQYRVCEEIPSDWVQTYPGSIDSPQCHIVDLPSGASSEWTVNMVEGPEYNFGNLQKGDITVYKFNDLNGNGEWDEEEPFLQDWKINISKLDTMSNTQMTGEDGKAVFRLLPDSYILSETMQEGWEQTGIYCEDTAEGVLITSPEEAYGHHGKCEGWNGCGNAETCALWACEVNGYSNLISYGDQRPCTRFNMCHLFSDLTPGYPYDEYINGHRIDWNWGNGCDVMGVTDIYCSNENGSIRRIADLSLASDVYHDKVYNLNVRPGDKKTCYIGNIENSELRVSETNDSWPNTLGIGDVFTYTIKVKAINGPVKDVVMTNLPPKGIEPQLGTFKAVSDKRGDLGSTGVVYASPGDWNLGNMEKDEVVTITYEAKVAANVDPGIYPDVSFAQGKGMGGSSLLALSEGSGFDINDGIVDENFVGTQVKIAVEKEMEDEVNVKEKKEGDVLGASTKLPATGANTMWLTILLIIASVGGLLLLIGGFGSMSTKKQKEIKKGNKVILGILTFGLVSLFSYKVFAADPVVRLSQPQSPASSEFNLVFVAMDIEDRKMTAQCWIQKPGASFESFGSSITIDSGKSGDSRICPVTESDLTSEGEYKFLVKVTPEGGSEISSNIVTVAYDGTGPDKPKYIEKEKINKCVNKITLKTADDGETSLVRVYADDDKEIDIDDSHKIETESIGPNKKFEFEHLMSGDDCGKTWYYAVVAFDDAGNASKPRSEVLTTTVTTTEEKEEETGAIPVEGGAGIAGVGGEVAGEGATGPEGAGGTEDTEEGKPLEVGVGEGEEGSVLGEKTGEEGKTLFKSAWFWIAAAGLGILIISATKKSKKN